MSPPRQQADMTVYEGMATTEDILALMELEV